MSIQEYADERLLVEFNGMAHEICEFTYGLHEENFSEEGGKMLIAGYYSMYSQLRNEVKKRGLII